MIVLPLRYDAAADLRLQSAAGAAQLGSLQRQCDVRVVCLEVTLQRSSSYCANPKLRILWRGLAGRRRRLPSHKSLL